MLTLAVVVIAGICVMTSCSKDDKNLNTTSMTSQLKSDWPPNPNPGGGTGFGIWIDSEKDIRGKCHRVKKLHFCAEWPWAHALELSELELQKSSYMFPVSCNTTANTLEMMFNYSFLSNDEIEMIESELEQKQTVEFPAVNIHFNKEFCNLGLPSNASLIEGTYQITSWSSKEKTFILTIDYIPIENK